MENASPVYQLLLLIHTWLRWGVVISAALVVAIAATRRRAGWNRTGDAAVLACLGISVAEFATGFILYVFLTSWLSALVAFPAQVVGSRGLRFWAIEHTAAAVGSLALIWWGRQRVLAAPQDQKGRAALLWFGLALVLILISIPWPLYKFGRPLVRLVMGEG